MFFFKCFYNIKKYFVNQIFCSKFYCQAFTLAEVLITLGIIGVVAALTLPILIQNHNEKATVTKVQKMYSVLQNAYNLYLAEENPVVSPEFSADGASTVASWFIPYLNVAKDCGTTNEGECVFYGLYKNKDGGNHNNFAADNHYYKILLNDGSPLLFKGSGSSNVLGSIFYDVNGKNPPNQFGYDLFTFRIQSDPNRVVPGGISELFYPFNSDCASINSSGYGCTIWLIQQGNMKYLKHHNLTLN